MKYRCVYMDQTGESDLEKVLKSLVHVDFPFPAFQDGIKTQNGPQKINYEQNVHYTALNVY